MGLFDPLEATEGFLGIHKKFGIVRIEKWNYQHRFLRNADMVKGNPAVMRGRPEGWTAKIITKSNTDWYVDHNELVACPTPTEIAWWKTGQHNKIGWGRGPDKANFDIGYHTYTVNAYRIEIKVNIPDAVDKDE